jgi:hypothetical protein
MDTQSKVIVIVIELLIGFAYIVVTDKYLITYISDNQDIHDVYVTAKNSGKRYTFLNESLLIETSVISSENLQNQVLSAEVIDSSSVYLGYPAIRLRETHLLSNYWLGQGTATVVTEKTIGNPHQLIEAIPVHLHKQLPWISYSGSIDGFVLENYEVTHGQEAAILLHRVVDIRYTDKIDHRIEHPLQIANKTIE